MDTTKKSRTRTASRAAPKSRTASRAAPKNTTAQVKKAPLKSTFYGDIAKDDVSDSPGLYGYDSYQRKKKYKEFEDYLKEKEKEKKHKKKKDKLKHELDRFKKHDFDDYYKYIHHKNKDRYITQDPKRHKEYNEQVQDKLKKEIAEIEAENEQAFSKLEQLVNGYLQEWLQIAPRSMEEALEVARTCGKPCFLKPNTGEYAVCPRCGPAGCYCAPMCSGLYNANLLAQRRGDKHSLQLARKLALEFGCDWALLLNAYLEHKYPNALKKFY